MSPINLEDSLGSLASIPGKAYQRSAPLCFGPRVVSASHLPSPLIPFLALQRKETFSPRYHRFSIFRVSSFFFLQSRLFGR